MVYKIKNEIILTKKKQKTAMAKSSKNFVVKIRMGFLHHSNLVLLSLEMLRFS